MTKNPFENLTKVLRQWLVSLLLLFTFLEVFLTIFSILGLPGSFSLNRIILLAFPIILGLGVVYLFIGNYKNPTWIPDWIRKTNEKPRLGNIVQTGLWLSVIILWAVAFLPISEMGRWGALYFRLQPDLLLAFFAFVQLLTGWLFFTRTRNINSKIEFDRSSIIAGAILTITFLLIAFVIRITGLGIGVGTQYWGKVGTPILHWQIAISLGFAMAGLFFVRRMKNLKAPFWVLDLIVVAGLWTAAFLVWQAIPLDISRFTTQPYPPNYVSYPFSDAGNYVLSAESIFVGTGFQFGYIDKPLHVTFLAMLRFLGGTDFSNMIWLQVAFLSIIPGLIYLITSRLSNRYAGSFAALLIIFMQSNSLSAINRIQVSNVKMMMSEPLTALMLLLVCLSVISWWKNPGGTWGYPALAGALVGLSGLVRLNGLVIIPFLAGVWLVHFGIRKKKSWFSVLVFILFCIIPLVPWMVRNQIKLGEPLAAITSKTHGVIVKNRFSPVINDTVETPLALEKPDQPAGRNVVVPEKKGIMGLAQPMLHTGFHNLVAVGLVLPASWTHTSLDNTIRQPYWDLEWDGIFTPGGEVVFALSLLFVVIGFSLGWRKNRVIALIPLLILVPYLLSNTYSLVSGGRYIVPVDWILPVYFSIGMVAVFMWLLKIRLVRETNSAEEILPDRFKQLFKPEKLVWIVLLIACIPTALSLSIPKKYTQTQSADTIKVLEDNISGFPTTLPLSEIKDFASTKSEVIFLGQAVFPRWMKSGVGDTGGSGTAFSALPFDHLSFSMISYPYSPFNVVLPINEQVSFLPNSSEVIVIGCKADTYFDAVAVYVLSPEKATYFRPDIKKLECPLPKP